MDAQPIILHRHAFVKALAQSLRGRCGVKEGDRLVLAVSGGADSVALLRAVHALALQPHWNLDLHVAHVNHHLREQADGDEAFVKKLCESLSLPFYRADIDVKDRPGNLEANARKQRYAALAAIAANVKADAVVTAHHADDQLETMLMRMIRGASIRGLSGMVSKRRLAGCDAWLIRPMLNTDHAAAIGFLRDIHQKWREDHTNMDTTRWRGRLREKVLPVLRSMRADAAVKAAETAQSLGRSARWMRAVERRRARAVVKTDRESEGFVMSREEARKMDPELLLGVVRQVCLKSGVSLDALPSRLLSSITAAVQSQSGETHRFDLAGGVKVVVESENVRWLRYDRADDTHDQR